MIDNLASILVAVAAIFSIAVMFFVARRVFTGALVPMEVKDLKEAQERHIAELMIQNSALHDERATEKAQLRQLTKDATEAIFAIHAWLTRYETLGGFAVGPTVSPRSTEPHRAPSE